MQHLDELDDVREIGTVSAKSHRHKNIMGTIVNTMLAKLVRVWVFTRLSFNQSACTFPYFEGNVHCIIKFLTNSRVNPFDISALRTSPMHEFATPSLHIVCIQSLIVWSTGL
jgi:hypothetical protein